MEGNKRLASAARSATYNMILQVVFRMLTFVLNAFVLRYISKEMLGVVNVRLTLLYSTTLFVAREAFRRACLSKTADRKWRQVINLLWCTVLLGIVCGLALAYFWLRLLERPDPERVPNYSVGVIVFTLSAVLELLAEPLYVIGQALLFIKLKVVIEGVAILCRCILTVLLVIAFPHWGIVAFCWSQLAFTLIYVGLYYAYFIKYLYTSEDESFPLKTVRDFFPRTNPGQKWTNLTLLKLTWSFFKQGFFKQILTEGEKYVMTFFNVASFADQGLYDIITNLGSLAARFIFFPIEESGYLFFAQTLTRGVPVKEQAEDAVALATKVLENLLKFVFLLGMTILVFGYPYAYLLLDLYGGSLLSSGSGPTLLSCYCVYVLLIAINGTMEAFVFAAMSSQDVDRYNHKLLVFSVIFLFFSWLFTKLIGVLGFIFANCINMSVRIIYSIYFVKNYYKDTKYRPLKCLIPSTMVLIAYIVSIIITVISETLCCDKGRLYQLVHVCIGGLCCLGVSLTIYFSEYDMIDFIMQQFITRKEALKAKKKN
ncbi:man(5)GlcNAc(2)-PP-dolichol translocation protein RFT1-like isoform X2 [Ptychodera flava]|uniref:man(5)GlcNAc(2)-PP-dolichol translocation protein RFT1-like isoform X2 n=1 Tax=Ptychodera flava TaxID=63121 RepID=UPI00396AA2AF